MIPQSIALWLERTGDRINPILVKETRQALKSRQFTGTFMLLLSASLIVSFGGVALAGPNIDYQSTGAVFFLAYYAILAFAIFMVVPFGAYRSLAAEQEERTYELLSVTTLRPGQIVTGKLFSSIIQMFIYYSAIAPFMAFTYLLKGIDMPAILFVLFVSLCVSIAYCMVGLLLATFASRRGWQVILSVAMIAGLGFATIVSVPATAEILNELGGVFRDPEFWVVMGCLSTAYVTTFALLFQISVSQLTFESDNRSSKIRMVMFGQFLCAVAWVSWGWIMELQGERVFLAVAAMLGCFYWTVMGSFLIAEPEGISRRVARKIPVSGFMRSLTAHFFPGPGSGLAFVLMHLLLILSIVGLAELTETWAVVNYRPRGVRGEATAMTLAMVSYAFFYLGLAAIGVRILRRFRPLPPLAGAAITAILATAGSLIPNFFVMTLRTNYYQVYEFWQITDPIATVEFISRNSAKALPHVLIPAAMAGIVFLINLPSMARAACQLRALAPRRLIAAPASPQPYRHHATAGELAPVQTQS